MTDILDAQCPLLACQNSISLRSYLKAADDMLHTARQYQTADDLFRSYVCYKRFINLVIHTIPSHNSYNLKQFQPERSHYRKLAKKAIENLEEMHPTVLSLLNGLVEEEPVPKPFECLPVLESCSCSTANYEAEEIKHDQIDAPLAAVQFVRQSQVEAPASIFPSISKSSLSDPRTSPSLFASNSHFPVSSAGVSSHLLHSDSAPTAVFPATVAFPAAALPAAAPGLSLVSGAFGAAAAGVPYPRSNEHSSRSRQSVSALRPVVVPDNLVPDFLRYARTNTMLDRETCATMCGKMENGVFLVTTVIIPKQKGTANTVVTMAEEELINIQIENDLITLGWIHTHPTQDCFLSSVDLHMQYSYQVMIDESIAIVCAPRFQKSGCFSLTSKGKSTLQTCSLQGFHQHYENEGLYQVAAHMSITPDTQCSFYDLR